MRRMFAATVALFAASLLTTGCTPIKTPPKATKVAAHEHPDKGPHGGALIEWGDEEYHLEFTVDHGKKQSTIYVLDETAAKAKPIAAETLELVLTHAAPPIVIVLKADPETADPKGKASRFVGVHDELGKEMEFKGEVRAKVGNTPYTGTFEEKAHDHKKK